MPSCIPHIPFHAFLKTLWILGILLMSDFLGLIDICLTCRDESEVVIHSDDAFAPVGYLNFKSMHLEEKTEVSGIQEWVNIIIR